MPNVYITEYATFGLGSTTSAGNRTLVTTQTIATGAGNRSAPFSPITDVIGLTADPGITAFVTKGRAPTAVSNGMPITTVPIVIDVLAGQQLAVL